MSNTNQLPPAAMRLILDAAVEFLAAKHSVASEQIATALRDGNKKIWNQLNELLEIGAQTAEGLS